VWFPADTDDTGTVDSNTSTVMTDSSQSWLDDQLVGMALQVTSGTYDGNVYMITGNTATTVTVSGSLPSVAGATYAVRPYGQVSYSACCGLVAEERDRRGMTVYYDRDGSGNVTGVRNDVTGDSSTYPLAKYTYNDLGQVTELKTYKDSSDSTGRPTTYSYDQLGRVKQISYPTGNGGTRLLWDEYYQYDVNNNPVAKLVGTVSSGSITAGSVTAYEYDSLNRLTKVKYDYAGVNDSWPIASISISSENVSYTYSGGSGLKTQMVDASGTSSYTYDTQGRLATYTPPLPANFTVEYSYNAAGGEDIGSDEGKQRKQV
jgi:YD repeat-containing protein